MLTEDLLDWNLKSVKAGDVWNTTLDGTRNVISLRKYIKITLLALIEIIYPRFPHNLTELQV